MSIKTIVVEFLKKSKITVSPRGVEISTDPMVMVMFYRENGIRFYDLWNLYSKEEQDQLIIERFIVR